MNYEPHKRIGLHELIEKSEAKKTEAELAKRDSSELVSRASELEERYRKRTGRDLSVLESANAVAFTRWPQHAHSYLVVPEKELLETLYSVGLYDRPRKGYAKERKPEPGINNPYIAWPSALCFPAALYASMNSPETLEFKIVKELAKIVPGARFDVERDRFTQEISNSTGLEPGWFARAMLFSLPGELYQNSLGVAYMPELRAHVISLGLFENLIRENAVRSDRPEKALEFLYGMKLSEYFRMASENLDRIEDLVNQSRGIKEQFEHFERERQTLLGEKVTRVFSEIVSSLERNPHLRRSPFAFVYDKLSSTANGYENLRFGVFPEKKVLTVGFQKQRPYGNRQSA
ncbi:hypothetical protein D6764_05065 [Candidatus Woesearchaeota archaeon]|nr:MAG: hypothetical protein D6764_05065 [Candidatus Woesearchaeota archaeon]